MAKQKHFFGRLVKLSTIVLPALVFGLVLAGCPTDAGDDALTGTVTISGTPNVGEILQVSFSGPSTSSYQWKSGSSNISGATGKSYTLLAADKGKTITVEVSCEGYTGSITSAPTATVGDATVKGFPDSLPKDPDGFTRLYTNSSESYGYSNWWYMTHTGDTTYEVDIKKMSGNASYGYGFVFHANAGTGATGTKGFYSVLVTINGYYRIIKSIGAASPLTTTSLKNGTGYDDKGWSTAPAAGFITGYNKTNRIKVVRSAGTFTVSFNGTVATTFTDTTLSGPLYKIGPYVSTGDEEDEKFPNDPVDVRFKVIQ